MAGWLLAHTLATGAVSCSNWPMRQLRSASCVTFFALASFALASAWGAVAGGESLPGSAKGSAAPAVKPAGSAVGGSVTAPNPSGVSVRMRETPVPVAEKAAGASGSGTPVAASDHAARDPGSARPFVNPGESPVKRSVSRPKVRKAIDPSRPVAHAPNFEMKADGSSTVTVQLSQAVPVEPWAAKSRHPSPRVLEFLIKGAQIGVRNNTNPLVTEHFQTPLQQVVLKPDGHNARLTLVFREDVTVKPVLVAGLGGSVVVQFTIPKATRSYSVAKARKPSVPKDNND